MMKLQMTKYIMLLPLSALLLIGCGDDDSDPAIDPRSAYTGNYELDEFDLTLTGSEDSTLTVDSGIVLDIDPAADEEEVEFEMEVFISELLVAVGSSSLYANFDDKIEVELDEGEFDIESFDFSIGSTVSGEISIDGVVESGMIEFDFNVTVAEGSFELIMDGSAKGSRE